MEFMQVTINCELKMAILAAGYAIRGRYSIQRWKAILEPGYAVRGTQ